MLEFKVTWKWMFLSWHSARVSVSGCKGSNLHHNRPVHSKLANIYTYIYIIELTTSSAPLAG